MLRPRMLRSANEEYDNDHFSFHRSAQRRRARDVHRRDSRRWTSRPSIRRSPRTSAPPTRSPSTPSPPPGWPARRLPSRSRWTAIASARAPPRSTRRSGAGASGWTARPAGGSPPASCLPPSAIGASPPSRSSPPAARRTGWCRRWRGFAANPRLVGDAARLDALKGATTELGAAVDAWEESLRLRAVAVAAHGAATRRFDSAYGVVVRLLRSVDPDRAASTLPIFVRSRSGSAPPAAAAPAPAPTELPPSEDPEVADPTT